MLSGFLKYCTKTDLIIKNPLLAVRLPKNRQPQNSKKPSLSNEEIKQMVLHAQKHPDAFVFVFAIFAGLRQGEILALTHRDIKDNLISVSKTLHYLSVEGRYQTITAPAKTANSVRQIPVFENLLPMLHAHIEAEKEKHRRLGIDFSEDSALFSSLNCGYDNGRNLRRRLRRMYTKLGIEPTTFHGLRHTFCTALARNGVGVKIASELMGHSNVATTLKIYTHVQEEEKQKGIAALAGVFSGEADI
jgi:integrase